ncbi:MAG TPA: polyhydroxyalkanoate synthesis repressor PhaR [Gammaproteobacteria bacterium]|nr:polyhydroxyalkanoate synthesis repressor PhaR [Gammaproteobacteria bacterium]HBX26434.1 polyhydroxyalkanoate synthesis repressor PhaR [Gammaproteobacteria bacterium]|tara:strand:- start:250 stop:705 length:456 start_codon:yes stop_codon:yes gene_type:complete
MRTLKKYPNRRLYDTSQSCYVTIDNVRDLVLGHERFRVVDSKSGEDITRSILLQIIIEQENVAGEHVLTNEVLQHLIRFYGSGLQTNMAHFLEQSISFFLNQQEAMQDQVRNVMGTNSPMGMWQKMTEENMKLWESMSKTMGSGNPSGRDN